jgi:site-specific DNA-methyltransferase (adenine-specific)
MSGPEPYYADETVALYVGDCREVLPALGVAADLVVADPPYGETSLAWDRWPDGWLATVAEVTRSLWCFGSMRMFLQHGHAFADAGWKLSQDVIWQKNTGSSFVADRFRRVHEHALHWYRGQWRDVHHEAVRVPHDGPNWGRRRNGPSRAQHFGGVRQNTWSDDGTRLLSSVIPAQNLRGKAIHPTEKPIGILTPLIEYGCPIGGTVLDPFAGSGSTLEAARLSGRRAIGVEADEGYAEKAALRLAQAPLEFEALGGG